VADSSLLDYETSGGTMTVTVEVSDDEVPSKASTAVMTINLSDVAEVPQIEDQSYAVDENAAVGTVVGTLLLKDLDAGDTHSYTISNASVAGVFEVVDTGSAVEIRVLDATALDREMLTSITFDVTVDDGTTPATGTMTVTINDVAEVPQIEDQSYAGDENAAVGTVVGTLLLKDLDAGDTHSYTISNASVAGVFEVVDTGSAVEIRVLDATALDREMLTSITFDVTVDDGTTPATGTMTVTINDVAETPTIEAETFGPLAEDAADDTVVGTVTSGNLDAGDTHTYTITGQSTPGAFAINSSTGEITVADSSLLDYETSGGTMTVTVEVSDDEVPSKASTAVMTINLSDVNDPPTVTLQNVVTSLAEDADTSSAIKVADVVVSDDALGSNTLSLSGTDAAMFELFDNGGNIELRLAAGTFLDHEALAQLSVTVEVDDPTVGVGVDDQATLTLDITNVVEPPTIDVIRIIDGEHIVDDVTETDFGTVLINGPASEYVFNIINRGDSPLSIDNVAIPAGFSFLPVTLVGSTIQPGVVATLTVSFDPSLAQAYSGAIAIATNDPVYDMGNPEFDIKVTGVGSDNSPPTVDDQMFSLAENSSNGSTAGTIGASDPDMDTLSYAITGGNTSGTFAIDAGTGALIVLDNSLLDFEAIQEFVLEITVMDPSGEHDSALITVNVTDVDESAVAPATQSFSISEYASAGTIVGYLQAFEPEQGALTFSGGNSAFAVDSETGEVTVVDPTAMLTGANSVVFSVNGQSISASITVIGESLPASQSLSARSYEVSHTKSLKFNPASEFAFANGQEYSTSVDATRQAVLAVDVDGTLYGPGESVDLTFGTILVNDDFTLSYTPFSNLPQRLVDPLLPEMDGNGQVYRYVGQELGAISYQVIQKDGGDVHTGQATLLASGVLSLSVTNSLPVYLGDRVYRDSMGGFYADADIALNFDTTMQIDIEKLFFDADGDSFQISTVEYDGNMGSSHSVQIGSIETGAPFFSSIPRRLYVDQLGESIVEVYNEVDQSDTNPSGDREWSTNDYPSRLEFSIHIESDQYDESFDDDWTTQFNFAIRPNVYTSQSLFRLLTQAPHQEYRSWLSEYSVSEQTRGDAGLASAVRQEEWTVVSETRVIDRDSNSRTSIGGVEIDLESGQFLLGHEFTMDRSGGAELSIPGLVYDSATVSQLPVIQSVIARKAGQPTPDSIDVELRWYDHINSGGDPGGRELITSATYDLTGIDPNQTEYLVAIQPQEAPLASGLYGWQLVATLNFASGAPLTITSSGQTPMIVEEPVATADYESGSPNPQEFTPIFGSGWRLAGLPTLIYDDNSDNKFETFLLHFPSEPVRIFEVGTGTTYESLQAGTRSLDAPQEYGTLQGVGGSDNEIVYNPGDGTEYFFKKYNIDGEDQWLLDRVEQSGVDFDPANPTANARQGLTLIRNQTSLSEDFGRLEKIRSSDGSESTLVYDASGYVDKLVLPGGNEIDLTIDSSGDLTEIRHINGIEDNPGLEINDRVRSFTYTGSSQITTDRWISVSTGDPIGAGTVQRETSFRYDHGPTGGAAGTSLLAEIQVVTGENDEIRYQIEPVALEGQKRDGGSLLVSDPDSLFATTRLIADDLESYDAQTKAGMSNAGDYLTEYTFNFAGQQTQRAEFFDDGQGMPTLISSEKWTYDHIGSVKTHEDAIGRLTTYNYDYEIPVTYAVSDPDDGNQDTGYTYDPKDYRGNVIGILDPSGYTSFEYETDDEAGDAVGRLVRTVDPRGVVTVYSRQNDGRLLSKRTIRNVDDSVTASDAAEQQDFTESWTYYDSASLFAGLLQTYTNTLGLVTTYTYDTNRRIATATTEDEGIFDQINGNAAAGTSEVRSVEYAYDTFGFVDSVVYKEDGVTTGSEDSDYDATGLLRRKQALDPSEDALSSVTYDYDADGRVNEMTDGLGTATTYQYNTAGLLTQMVAAVGQVFETAAGVLKSIEETTKYTYYANGALKQVEAPDLAKTEYFYDPASRKTWVSQEGIAGDNLLDSQGDIKAPDSADFEKQVQLSEFDELGRVILEQDLLMGTTAEYKYQDQRHDLPTQISRSVNVGEMQNGDSPVSYSEDQVGKHIEEYRYDAAGNVIFEQVAGQSPSGSIDSQVPTRHVYDELGHQSFSYKVADHGAKLSFTTNAAGQVIEQVETRSTPDGTSIGTYLTSSITTKWQYDEQGRLRRMLDAEAEAEANADAVKTDYDFDVTAQLQKVTSTSREGFGSIQWFDAVGQLVKDMNVFGGVTDYTYDLNGNVLSEQFIPAVLDSDLPDRLTEFEYDALNRQRKITQKGDGASNPDRITRMDYFTADVDHNWNQYGYDTIVTDARGNTTSTVYDSAGNPIIVRQADPGTVELAGQNPTADTTYVLSTYNYDAAAQVRAVTTRLTTGLDDDPAHNSDDNASSVANTGDGIRISRTVTNANGQVLMSAVKKWTSTTTSDATSEDTYLEAPINEVTPFELQSRYAYLVDGRVQASFQGGAFTAFAYDDRPNHTATGQLIVERNVKGGSKQIKKYAYDSSGNLILSAIGGGNPYEFTSLTAVEREYDQIGRLISESGNVDEQNLSTGEVSTTVDGTRSWQYSGYETTFTDRNQDVTTTTVDPWNFETREITTGPNNYAYSRTTTYNSDGSVEKVQDSLAKDGYSGSTSELTFSYDVFGNQDQSTQAFTFGASTFDTLTVDVTSFFEMGQRKEVEAFLNGSLVSRTNYGLDGRNRINSIRQDMADSYSSNWRNGGEGTDKGVVYEYNPDGTVEKIYRFTDLPLPTASFAIGVNEHGFTEKTYSEIGRPSHIRHYQDFTNRSATTLIASQTSVVNADGTPAENSFTFQDAAGIVLASSKVIGYKVTEDGMLVSSPAGTAGTTNNRLFDDAGNPVGTVFDIGSSNRLLEDILYRYVYDAEGRLIRRIEKLDTGSLREGYYTIFEWDHQGRLLKTERRDDTGVLLNSIEYAYDAAGRKVVTAGTGQVTHHYYDGNQRLFDVNASDEIFQAYLTNPQSGELVAIDHASLTDGTVSHAYWAFNDLENNVTSWANYSGSGWTIGHVDFDAYGRVTRTLGANIADLLPFIWHGTQRDQLILDFSVDPFYVIGGHAYDPYQQRYAVDTGAIGNGYVFNGNQPFKEWGRVDADYRGTNNIDWEAIEGSSAFTTWGSVGFGLLDTASFGWYFSHDTRSQTNSGYYAGAVLGIGAQIAGAVLTGGTTTVIGGGLRAGGVTGAIAAARTAGVSRSALALSYAGYAAAGDAIGVYQSTTASMDGTFTPIDLLGFVPTIGYARSLRGGVQRRAAENFVAPTRTRAFFTDADPARRVMGSARLSHADEIAEMRRLMDAEGVEIIERSGTMAYGPSSRAGRPGQFIIDPDASYSAWKHEFRHFLDDQASGWDGMSALMDKNTRWAWESAAYAEEISLMRRLGRQDVIDELIKLRTKEWQNIFMPHLGN